MNCPSCQGEVYDIDVKCQHCGAALGATGAHRMLGQKILGVYELVDVLGQGGMSVVFKGRHAMTDQEVALKILPPELAAHSQVKGRFLEEAKALAALDHPNIVHLYNFGQENGSFVLAMQYVQGKTWERAILEAKQLDWVSSLRITIDVLKALDYAHSRGVVHRDMKPSNVLVRANDGAATVMDFGIAKMAQSTKLTATGQTMGTVRYMSPEQVRGQDVDLRTDLYSLGATLYESLTGDTPFDGSTHFEIMTKHLSEVAKPPSSHGVVVPKAVEDAIMRSLSKKADDRFESAREMRKIFEQALKDGDVGLVETQRINREILTDITPIPAQPTRNERSPGSRGPAPTGRAATANDLADELEPGSTSAEAIVRPTRAKWPYIVLSLLILGGAGAAAAVVLLDKKEPASYRAKTRLTGVKLAAGKKFDKLFIETTSAVTPDDVYTAYSVALAELEIFEPNMKAQRAVIEEIVVVPQEALCLPAITRAAPDRTCAASDLFTTALAGSKRQLLVSDNPQTLASALRHGVAQAACDFSFAVLDPNADERESAKAIEQVCGMAMRFRAK